MLNILQTNEDQVDSAPRRRTLASGQDRVVLIGNAYARLRRMMAEYGTVLSDDHHRALALVLDTFIKTALGRYSKRQGIPLPMGGGKTLATVCFAASLVELNFDTSLVIATYRLRDMQDLYHALRGQGVPAKDIGLLHSETNEEKIVLPPTTGNGSRRIVLVTHRRLQAGEGAVEQYGFYQGRPRDLVIYDESLVSTENWAVSVRSVVESLGATERLVTKLRGADSPAARAAVAYLQTVEDLMLAEMDSLAAGNKPSRILFPSLPETYSVNDLVGSLDADWREQVRPIFENAGGAARGVSLQGRDGLVWFEVTVPDELTNMVVLDASLVVRMLPELSGEIQVVKDFPKRVISYEDVTLHTMKAGVGRKKTDAVFNNTRSLNAYCREIAHVIKHRIPKDEAINLFVFKDKGRRAYARKLDKALRLAGVRLDQRLADGSRKFNVITWGEETASNQWRHARHTIFVSVLHRDTLDIASSIAAANRDLESDRNFDRAREILASEVAHSVAQAIGRSAVRVANNGKATAGTVWLPMAQPGVVEKLAKHALPGIKQEVWEKVEKGWSRKRKARENTKTREIAEAIKAVLSSSADNPISTRALRVAVEGTGIETSERPFKEAVALVTKSPPPGWTKAGRSWKKERS